jgi:DNA-binding phage protein
MADEPVRDDEESEDERLYREDESALFDAMAEVMEERGLSEEDLVPMLVGAVYHLRSLAYVAATAKPSEAGLRMDLDRLRKAIEEMHRDYRKNAATIVRDLLAALEAPPEPDVPDDAGPETVRPTSIISEGSGR